MTEQTPTRLRYPIDEGFALIGVNRTRGYTLIKNKELVTVLDGKRRFVSHKALMDYIERKEAA